MQLRDNNPNIMFPGKWSLFGGGINEGEDILMRIKREINEEIPGCLVRNRVFMGKGYVEIQNRRIINYWINEEYHSNNFKRIIKEIQFFNRRISREIDSINKRLTEGQKSRLF